MTLVLWLPGKTRPGVMSEWLSQQWKKACDGEMILVLDVHRAQKTERIIDRLSSLKTTPVYIYVVGPLT